MATKEEGEIMLASPRDLDACLGVVLTIESFIIKCLIQGYIDRHETPPKCLTKYNQQGHLAQDELARLAHLEDRPSSRPIGLPALSLHWLYAPPLPRVGHFFGKTAAGRGLYALVFAERPPAAPHHALLRQRLIARVGRLAGLIPPGDLFTSFLTISLGPPTTAPEYRSPLRNA